MSLQELNADIRLAEIKAETASRYTHQALLSHSKNRKVKLLRKARHYRDQAKNYMARARSAGAAEVWAVDLVKNFGLSPTKQLRELTEDNTCPTSKRSSVKKKVATKSSSTTPQQSTKPKKKSVATSKKAKKSSPSSAKAKTPSSTKKAPAEADGSKKTTKKKPAKAAQDKE